MKKENKRRIKRRLRKSKHLLLFSSNIICFHLLRLRANLSIPQLIFENQFYHPRAESPIKLSSLGEVTRSPATLAATEALSVLLMVFFRIWWVVFQQLGGRR